MNKACFRALYYIIDIITVRIIKKPKLNAENIPM